MSVVGQKRRREDDTNDDVGDGGVGRDETTNGLNPAKLMTGEKVSLPNPHLSGMESDYLYHLGYGRDEARQIFHDVKVREGERERRTRSLNVPVTHVCSCARIQCK